VGGGRYPGVTAPVPVKTVCGARWIGDSNCLGMDTELELSRAVGFQVSSHGPSRSFSDISDIVGCDSGSTVLGGEKSVHSVYRMGSWRCAGVGLVTYSVGPGLAAIVLLQGGSSVRRRLSVLCFADPLGRLSLMADGFENTVTATGGYLSRCGCPSSGLFQCCCWDHVSQGCCQFYPLN
jgi:hypothetical protein